MFRFAVPLCVLPPGKHGKAISSLSPFIGWKSLLCSHFGVIVQFEFFMSIVFYCQDHGGSIFSYLWKYAFKVSKTWAGSGGVCFLQVLLLSDFKRQHSACDHGDSTVSCRLKKASSIVFIGENSLVTSVTSYVYVYLCLFYKHAYFKRGLQLSKAQTKRSSRSN